MNVYEEEEYFEPDFDECGNCGADAKKYCYWDIGDGWQCSNCGGSDSDE